MLDKAKITPEVLLLEIADNLNRLENLMRAEEPVGDNMSMTLAVTDVPLEVNLGIWVKATVFNDIGGSDVYVYGIRQPADSRSAPLRAGNSLVFDEKRRTTKRKYLVCALGGTASARVFWQ